METIILHNERVMVTRVTLAPGETVTSNSRNDRVIVFLNDHEKIHTMKEPAHPAYNQANIITRKAGEAIFRPASMHSVENATNKAFDTLIIELL